MTDWDSGYDIVVVGSGVAGLTAAVTAAAAGAQPLVVEASQLWGGTSALSAGGLWVPDNHLMRADRVHDSADEAVRYLGEVIGDVGPASSPERRRAYAHGAPAMARFLADQGFGWRRAERWPDYHTELPGSRVGRMLEGVLFDVRRLGVVAESMRLPETIPPVPLQGGDIADIVLGVRSLRGMKAGAQTLARAATGLARNQRLVCMGQSLVAQLMYLAQRAEIPVRTLTAARARHRTRAGHRCRRRAGRAALDGAGP